jgi:putative phosphoribosyl transferase
MLAALHSVRAKHPLKLVCAVPVAPPDTVEKIAQHADEVVCLQTPVYFRAVGQFYEDFPQVEDNEVMRILSGPSPTLEGKAPSPPVGGEGGA